MENGRQVPDGFNTNISDVLMYVREPVSEMQKKSRGYARFFGTASL
jgi:hypothetical protein